jgi:GNAT superfamily N-acetyltransferase
MTGAREFEELVRRTGAYEDIEVQMLKEAFESYDRKPGEPFTVLELRDGKTLAGFAVMRREGSCSYSYTLQALCVDPTYIGKGVAEKLLEMIEEEALRLVVSAILRFELSAHKEAAFGAGILMARGYAILGHIADFYDAGNDYFMYAKHVTREKKE